MFGFGVKSITAAELAERLKHGRPVVIDVREPHEFKAGHVPGSRNIPLGKILAEAPRLNPNVETLLICHSGSRSGSAMKKLAKLGFTEVYSVRGGTRAWGGKLKR